MRARSGGSRTRAASTVEYALILVAVLLLAAGSYKLLGGQLAKRSNQSGDAVTNAEPGASPGAGANGAAGGGGGDGKSSVAGKVSVGGVGGVSGSDAVSNKPASTRDTSRESHGPISAITRGLTGGDDVSEGFTGKRWMGIGLLGAGLVFIVYVLISMRKAKKAGDAMVGKDGKGGGKARPRTKRA